MKLFVNELFGLTYQGEGPSTGSLCAFIRLSYCNQKCVFCFGIKPGRRVPRIITKEGQNKKLFNVKEGDVLLTYNDNKEMVETTVIQTLSREVEKWYELLIDNVLYFVTPEHPFFTNRGLIEAKDLTIGDQILHCLPHDKHVYRMTNSNPMKDPEVVERSKNSTDYEAQARKISQTIQRKKEEGTYQSIWELMSEETKVKVKKMASDRMKGKNNPNWAGGSKTPNFDILKLKCSSGELTICKKCGNKAKLEVHHLNDCPADEYSKNDQLENLTTWCHPCHSQYHKRGYNFWANERKDGKSLPEGIVARNGKEVQEIKYVDLTTKPFYGRPYGPKKLKVYNLSCFPYNSYLVDNMWVHNCDSFHTWGFEEKDLKNHIKHNTPVKKEDEVKEMTIGEILPFFVEKNPPLIIITGGEPMIQFRKLLHLIPAFAQHVPALTRIEIETAGTIFSSELTDFQYVFFNVSPKLENSGNPLEVRYKPHILKMFNTQAQAVFKFVVSQESDFEEIEDIINQVGIPKHKVYIMAEGELAEEQVERMRWLVPLSLEKRYNFTTRLHTLVWGNKRGV